MTWTYEQTTGRISQNGVYVGEGYSGFPPDGLNNHAMEAVHAVGPIPCGRWQIVRWDDVHGEKGPVVAVLVPVGHDAHGRTEFLIHGDSASHPGYASHGCLIAARPIREKWRASGDTHLEVVV